MDSGERRQQTARAARLGLLIGANLLAILFLVRSLTGDSAEVVGAQGDGGATQSQQVGMELEASAAVGTPAAAPVEPPAQVDAALVAQLEARIATTLRDAQKRSSGKVTASNTTIAVHVFDPAGDRVLVNRQARVPLRPASTMKLVTSAAALVALGEEWNFETRFESSGEIRDGVLEGDLVVHAEADPFFDPEAQGQVKHLLRPAIDQLRAQGVRSIRGRVILDEGRFLEPGPAPGWPSANQHWQEHCALSAGFSANAGCLTAVVRAGKSGSQAFSEVRPASNGLSRVGTVKTVSASARLNVAVGANATQATLRGEIPSSVPNWESRFAHPDPILLFERCLQSAFKTGGVSVSGGFVRERGRPPAKTLAVLRTPLTEVLAPINRDSNNAVADQLFFALGHSVGGEGSRAGGARAVVRALETLEVSAKGLVQVDGSGLSRDDRVTAEQLSSLLAGVLQREESLREVFVDSLAVAGRAGSLASRMKSEPALGRVFAKTGWIEGTGSLAGYVDTLGGRRLCFAILVDYPKVSGMNKYCWKPMQDLICADLVRWRPAGGRVR